MYSSLYTFFVLDNSKYIAIMYENLKSVLPFPFPYLIWYFDFTLDTGLIKNTIYTSSTTVANLNFCSSKFC